MNKNETNHNYGIDLLRIVAMLMIVAHHFSLHSGLSFDVGSNHDVLMRVLALGGKIGVNIFILISGYYSYGRFRREKFVRLIGHTTFYSLVLTLLAFALGSVALSKKLFIKAAFPWLLGNNYWFVVTYLELYLLSPILNKLIVELDTQYFKKYLTVFTILLCIVPKIVGRFIEVNDFGFNTLVWFIYLYFLGAYLKRQNTDRTPLQFLPLAVVLLLIQAIVCIVLNKGQWTGFFLLIMETISDYSVNAVFPLLIAVTMLIGFQNIKVIPCKKVIQTIATATFGVYLFHDNINFRGWLWQNTFSFISHCIPRSFVLKAVLTIFMVFALGVAIELLRSSITKILCRIIHIRE